jgi:pimeloyl-ACP methyl ester carboxylesterase
MRNACASAFLVIGLLSLTACGGLSRSRHAAELSPLAQRRLAGDLVRMAEGWSEMTQGSAKKRRDAEDGYERALASFLETWAAQQSPRRWQSGLEFSSDGGRRRFIVDFAPVPGWSSGLPQDYDDLLMPTRSMRRAGDTQALRAGVGVPLVGRIERTEEVRQARPFLPARGGNFTLTATMEVGAVDPGGVQRCTLRLHNALNTDTVEFPQGERQLAANFTAPKHHSLARRSFGRISLVGLLYPEKAIDSCELCRMDEYDPQRIPVVFVHGLMSDPHIWLNAVNAICTDPELRRHYQPWYFVYPTAMGVTQSAKLLRESLMAARDRFDPDHNDPGMEQMVLVGHSMGGLLSRMQATDSGDALWASNFRKPLTGLNVSAATRDRLQSSLFFKPLPFVKRTVFISTPHRGSEIASLSIVRRLASLIRIPLDSLTLANELLLGNTDALSPQITEWGLFSFVSVGMLSEKHPMLQGLDQTRPVAVHHSVIGDRGLPVPRSKTSDGVVPYWSSHLDSAVSEKMVPHGHGCVEQPDVVAEITRVLHEHLQSVRR